MPEEQEFAIEELMPEPPPPQIDWAAVDRRRQQEGWYGGPAPVPQPRVDPWAVPAYNIARENIQPLGAPQPAQPGQALVRDYAFVAIPPRYAVDNGWGEAPLKKAKQKGKWERITDLCHTNAKDGDVVCMIGAKPEVVFQSGMMDAARYNRGVALGYVLYLGGGKGIALANYTLVYMSPNGAGGTVGEVWRWSEKPILRMNPIHSRAHPFFTK